MRAPDGPGGLYPVVWRLGGRRALVVGGGAVAARKAAGLLEAGAHVVAVSPRFAPAFKRLVPRAAVTCLERPYRPTDLADVSVAIAATDDRTVNAQVRADARRVGVWVSVVDDPGRSDFIVPAVVRRGDFLLAISSGGASPGLVARLRRELDRLVPPDLGRLVRLLGTARARIRRAVPDPDRRRELLRRLLTLALRSTPRTRERDAVLGQISGLIAPGDPRPARPRGRPSSRETRRRRAPDGRR